MRHQIKIRNCFYERIISGAKTWELRKNDRDYQVGDMVVFELFEDSIYDSSPEIIVVSPEEYEITYLLQGFDGLQEGYCIFGIKELGTTKN